MGKKYCQGLLWSQLGKGGSEPWTDHTQEAEPQGTLAWVGTVAQVGSRCTRRIQVLQARLAASHIPWMPHTQVTPPACSLVGICRGHARAQTVGSQQVAHPH